VLLLCEPPLDAACASLKKAMDGIGTDETTLSFIIGGMCSSLYVPSCVLSCIILKGSVAN
jgi:hypothetical protein